MSYLAHYESPTLYHLDKPNGAVLYTQPYSTTDWRLCIGECVAIDIPVTQSNSLTSGQRYIYNFLAFATNGGTTPLDTTLQGGYIIDINNTTIGTSLPVIFSPSNGVTAQNGRVTVTVTGSKSFVIRHEFVVTAANVSWLANAFFPNKQRLLSVRSNESATLENSIPNTPYYNNYAAFEICVYEMDTANTGLYLNDIKHYVVDTSNPTNTTYILDVQLRFYDTVKFGETNYLRRIDVFDKYMNTRFTLATSGITTGLHDANYTATGVTSFAYLDENIINFDLIRTDFAVQPTHYILHIIDCTASNFVNQQPFLSEYVVDSVTIAASANTTPYPSHLTNWNGQSSAFSAPYDFTFAGGLSISIDGSKLAYGHEYRIIIVAYDSTAAAGTNFVSSHITPNVITNDVYQPNIPTANGRIITYNDTYTSNNLEVSPCERFTLALDVDFATDTTVYDELVNVRIDSVYTDSLGRVLRRETATLNNGITLDDTAAPQYIYTTAKRAHFDIFSSVGNVYSTHTWRLDFEHIDTGAGLQTYSITFDQLVTHKALDTGRITGIKFLNYADWIAGTRTELQTFCENDNKVIVEIEKNGTPNANLIGLFVNIFGGSTSIQETESYTGLLPLETSAIIGNSDATFGDNYAYFELDYSQLQTNALLYGVGALIYNI